MSNHHRFFVDPGNLSEKNFSSSDKKLINQIKNVFRLKAGDKIVVLDNSGYEFSVLLKNIDKKIIEGDILEKRKNEQGLNIKINLFCSLLKKDNFELILQKCTELGVFSITPLIYKNTVIKNFEKKERWEKIIKEAAEQSGCMKLPILNSVSTFGRVLDSVKGRKNLVADEKDENRIMNYEPCLPAGRLRIKNNKEINIFIGPEGGFDEKERELMRKNNFLFFNLGENILRSETAAIVSVGIVKEIVVE